MNEFVNYLTEVFEPFGPVNARKMFGGYGIYYDGVMIGLVADDTLYFKADKETVKYFEDKELGQFEYDKNGKAVKMSYYLAPEAIYDNSEEACVWAKRAYEAAFRAKAKKKKMK